MEPLSLEKLAKITSEGYTNTWTSTVCLNTDNYVQQTQTCLL